MSAPRMCNIYFSPLPSIPVFGHALLFFQVLLFCLHIVNVVFLPRYGGRFLKCLMRFLDKKSAMHVVHTFALGHILGYFKNTMVLDVKDTHEYILRSGESYQCALWTLIHVDAISTRTRLSLEKQLGYRVVGVLKEVRVVA